MEERQGEKDVAEEKEDKFSGGDVRDCRRITLPSSALQTSSKRGRLVLCRSKVPV